MDQETLTNDFGFTDIIEDDPILNFKLKLIKMKVNALLEELQTFEGASIAKRRVSLEQGIDFYHEIQRFEIDLIINALKCTRGHQSKAARILNVKLSTLNAKIKHYKIPVSDIEAVQIYSTSQKDAESGQHATSQQVLSPKDQTEQIAHPMY